MNLLFSVYLYVGVFCGLPALVVSSEAQRDRNSTVAAIIIWN